MSMNYPIEKQCCSLELAQRLKELGVPQKSVFYHREPSGIVIGNEHEMITRVSAFTIAELGEMLPSEMCDEHEDLPYLLTIEKAGGFWSVEYAGDRGGLEGLNFEGNTEADARAKMLVYLIENNFIDPKSL